MSRTINLDDPLEVNSAIRSALSAVSGDIRETAKYLDGKRRDCSARGYHQMEDDEPVCCGFKESYRFCRDCESVVDSDDEEIVMAQDCLPRK